MKTTLLLLFASLFIWQICLAELAQTPESDSSEPQTVVPTEQSADYARIARSLLQQHGERPDSQEGQDQSQESFLRYLDQPAADQIVANAFQTVFSEEEASQLADFLASDTGQAGIGIFSKWLLRGDFLKNPVPVELATTWETFRSTATGIKLFAEIYTLYKEIATQAMNIGGKLVAKAISSDIGKGAAGSLLGALLKSGAFFF